MSVLEFIAALKWPVTLLILVGSALVIRKRNPETRKAMGAALRSRNLRVNIAGQEVEATLAEAQDSMTTAVGTDEQLAEAVARARTAGVELPEITISADVAVGMLRREAVEDVMRRSARWGWEMPKSAIDRCLNRWSIGMPKANQKSVWGSQQ